MAHHPGRQASEVCIAVGSPLPDDHSLREYRPNKEDKDIVDQLGTLFTSIDTQSLGEILTLHMPLFVCFAASIA